MARNAQESRAKPKSRTKPNTEQRERSKEVNSAPENFENSIFNWMVSYFENRTHSTMFLGNVSGEETINASVVHCAGIELGPCILLSS